MTAMETESLIYKLVGQKVRDFRKESKLSQDDLAEVAGCSRITLSNLERGRQRISLEKLYAIALALGVDLPALMPTRQELNENTSATSPHPQHSTISSADRAALETLGIASGDVDAME